LVLSGILLGVALLFRPIALPLPLLLAALLLFRATDTRRWQRWIAAGVFLAVVVTVVAPWEVWMYRQSGRIMPLSNGGIPSIVDGLTWARPPSASFAVPAKVPPDVQEFMTELGQKYRSKEITTLGELARWLGEQAVHRPWVCGKILGYKVVRCWYATDSHRYETFCLLLQIPYLILASIGAIRLWRGGVPGREVALLAVAVVLTTWGMAVLVLSIVRYLMPVMDLLCLLAVAAIFSSRGNHERTSVLA
jgi:4-amino-4-deoxy-L-arabinose transferase-like glycosyltransferase